MDAGDFVMFRRTLLGSRKRAERYAQSRPGAAEPEDLSRGGVPLDVDLAVEIRRPPSAVYDVLAHRERHAVTRTHPWTGSSASPRASSKPPTTALAARREWPGLGVARRDGTLFHGHRADAMVLRP